MEIARVITESHEIYTLQTEQGIVQGELTGSLRFKAEGRLDLPVVGDYVNVDVFDDLAVIHGIEPRNTLLCRKSVSHKAEKQPIAANIDYAFIVTALDRDFKINRIERYLAIVRSGGIEPIVILNKTDILEQAELDEKLNRVKERLGDIAIIASSNVSGGGIDEIKNAIKSDKTYCFIGSSGVGKSTIINTLIGHDLMDTKEISDSTNRGRHTTTRRELITLENGGVLIDTPGMREVGLTDSAEGLDMTFEEIAVLAGDCFYSDCTHTTEKGCAILAAVENNELDHDIYANYIKMKKEVEYFQQTAYEKKQKDKSFGKMVKTAMKDSNRFKGK